MPKKKLLEESCVRNFRNPLFAKLLLFEILGHFQKLFWAKILGVQAVKCILVQNIYSVLKKIGNLWEKYRKKIGNL